MARIKINDHAQLRIKQRLGLPRKAMRRYVQTVMADGLTHSQTKGSLKKYITETIHRHEGKCNHPVVYGHHLFLFRGFRLITLTELPTELKPLADQLRAKIP